VGIAQTRFGAEAEALLAQDTPLPRDGTLLSLVDLRSVSVEARARLRRTGSDETEVYDSNESDEGDVVTRFMGGSAWRSALVTLPLLPPGLYLTRATVGAWSATALLSVGDLTVLVRRGDTQDTVLVTNPDGQPEGGVDVEVLHEGRSLARGRSDAHGRLTLPARNEATVRYLARSGADLSWVDVTHAPLSRCDPRLYLAVGRPTFRPDEDVHLRGHLRGCVGTREGPLGEEPVALGRGGGAEPVRVRTNADGDFTAVLPAASTLMATVRGTTHQRTLHLETAIPPEHPVELRLERPWVAPGETVTLLVRDAQGGWNEPARATLTAPGFSRTMDLGPGGPAVFTYLVPPTDEALTVTPFHVTVVGLGGVARASAELRSGRSRELVQVDLPITVGQTGQIVPVQVRVQDLGGAAVLGQALVEVYGTDGNRRGDGPRARMEGALDAQGHVTVELPLGGAGPWWIEAARPAAGSLARGSRVLWDRPRPPTFNASEALAVRPEQLALAPGVPLRFALRVPTPSATWVTLEQSGVVAEVLLPPGVTQGVLPVPEAARGRATLVATHLHGGEARTVTQALDVATAPTMQMTLSTDLAQYAPGATARVTVDTRDADGRGRDAVVTLWAAEAGWWALNPEEHPTPGAFLALPGRAASAGDNTRPQGYGAEEGRRLDTLLEWNGRALDGATFRHGWGHPTELVTLEARGTFGAVARSLALRSGLREAWVCPTAATTPTVSLRARNLPWDLVAQKVAAATETHALVRARVLRFECGPAVSIGSAYGSGSGMGLRGRGSGGGGVLERRSLLGTFFFLPLRHTGPGGHLELEVPMPAQPGRWRLEALAIAQDAASAQAHAEACTTLPLVVEARLPTPLRVGDEAQGLLVATAPGLVGRALTVSLTVRGPATLLSPPGAVATVGSDGVARAPFRVRVTGPGTVTMEARASLPGGIEDAVRVPLEVLEDPAVAELSVTSVVGPAGADLAIAIPTLRTPATVEVTIDPDLLPAVREVLQALRAPRWDLSFLRLDKLQALDALGAVVQGDPGLRAEVQRMRDNERANIDRLVAPDGLLPPFAGVTPGQWFLVRQALVLGDRWAAPEASELRTRIRALASRGASALDPELAWVLARSADAADRALAQRVLQRVASPAHVDGLLAALRAALAVAPTERARRAEALAAWVERALGQGRGAPCRGPAWWLCLARDGERGSMARAALALHDAGLRGDLVDATLQRLARPAGREGLAWGTAEADVLALVHRLRGPTAPRSSVTVTLDGAQLAQGDAAQGLRVTVPRGGALAIAVGPEASRFARVSVRGGLPVAPPSTTLGPAALGATLEGPAGARILVLQWSLTAPAEDLEVRVPLPAGLVPAAPLGRGPATSTVRSPELSFFLPWETGPADSVARTAYIDGALVVRYRRLGVGRHALRVALTSQGEGTFHAGSPALRARDPAVWSLAPPLAP
jgi:hypothetical protein